MRGVTQFHRRDPSRSQMRSLRRGLSDSGCLAALGRCQQWMQLLAAHPLGRVVRVKGVSLLLSHCCAQHVGERQDEL